MVGNSNIKNNNVKSNKKKCENFSDEQTLSSSNQDLFSLDEGIDDTDVLCDIFKNDENALEGNSLGNLDSSSLNLDSMEKFLENIDREDFLLQDKTISSDIVQSENDDNEILMMVNPTTKTIVSDIKITPTFSTKKLKTPKTTEKPSQKLKRKICLITDSDCSKETLDKNKNEFVSSKLIRHKSSTCQQHLQCKASGICIFFLADSKNTNLALDDVELAKQSKEMLFKFIQHLEKKIAKIGGIKSLSSFYELQEKLQPKLEMENSKRNTFFICTLKASSLSSAEIHEDILSFTFNVLGFVYPLYYSFVKNLFFVNSSLSNVVYYQSRLDRSLVAYFMRRQTQITDDPKISLTISCISKSFGTHHKDKILFFLNEVSKHLNIMIESDSLSYYSLYSQSIQLFFGENIVDILRYSLLVIYPVNQLEKGSFLLKIVNQDLNKALDKPMDLEMYNIIFLNINVLLDKHRVDFLENQKSQSLKWHDVYTADCVNKLNYKIFFANTEDLSSNLCCAYNVSNVDLDIHYRDRNLLFPLMHFMLAEKYVNSFELRSQLLFVADTPESLRDKGKKICFLYGEGSVCEFYHLVQQENYLPENFVMTKIQKNLLSYYKLASSCCYYDDNGKIFTIDQNTFLQYFPSIYNILYEMSKSVPEGKMLFVNWGLKISDQFSQLFLLQMLLDISFDSENKSFTLFSNNTPFLKKNNCSFAFYQHPFCLKTEYLDFKNTIKKRVLYFHTIKINQQHIDKASKEFFSLLDTTDLDAIDLDIADLDNQSKSQKQDSDIDQSLAKQIKLF
ncbi:hypothetical protein AB837_00273 [bacterium AB1]|nr:hypothetical protein AB837_00273 [bacterium AB1]